MAATKKLVTEFKAKVLAKIDELIKKETDREIEGHEIKVGTYEKVKQAVNQLDEDMAIALKMQVLALIYSLKPQGTQDGDDNQDQSEDDGVGTESEIKMRALADCQKSV